MTALDRPLTRRAALHARPVTALLLLGFGFLLLLPNWLALPPDDENLSKEIVGTVFQSKELFAGHYPFWGHPSPHEGGVLA